MTLFQGETLKDGICDIRTCPFIRGGLYEGFHRNWGVHVGILVCTYQCINPYIDPKEMWQAHAYMGMLLAISDATYQYDLNLSVGKGLMQGGVDCSMQQSGMGGLYHFRFLPVTPSCL